MSRSKPTRSLAYTLITVIAVVLFVLATGTALIAINSQDSMGVTAVNTFNVAAIVLLTLLFVCIAFGLVTTLLIVIPEFVQSVRSRGGDRSEPDRDLNAYKQYFCGPVLTDFVAACGVGFAWIRESPRLLLPGALVAGLALGAFLVLGAAICLLVVAAVTSAAAFLRLVERVQMRLRGAGFTCASCHAQFQLPVYRCPGVTGSPCGLEHRSLLPGSYGLFRQRCACGGAELPTLLANGRAEIAAYCPDCGTSLPGESGQLRQVRTPIAGGPASGKTTLTAAAVTEMALLQADGALEMSILGSDSPVVGDLLEEFASGARLSPTQRGGPDGRAPAVLVRIKPKTGSRALVFIYDVAGEMYLDSAELRNQPMLTDFEGAVLVIDPFSLDPVREELGARDAVAEWPAYAYQRLVEAISERQGDPGSLPLAVVLTKADVLQDSRMPVVRGQVRAWLSAAGEDNLLLSAEQDFREVRYFVVSAYDRRPGRLAADDSFDSPLAPFAWIMQESGVAIPREASADVSPGRATGAIQEALNDGEALDYAPDRSPVKVRPGSPVAKGSGSLKRYVAPLSILAGLMVGAVAALAISSAISTESRADRRERRAQERKTERIADKVMRREASRLRRRLTGTWRALDLVAVAPMTVSVYPRSSGGRLVGSASVDGCVTRLSEVMLGDRFVRKYPLESYYTGPAPFSVVRGRRAQSADLRVEVALGLNSLFEKARAMSPRSRPQVLEPEGLLFLSEKPGKDRSDCGDGYALLYPARRPARNSPWSDPPPRGRYAGFYSLSGERDDLLRR